MCTEYERLKLQARSFDEKTARDLDHRMKTVEQTLFDLYQQDAAGMHSNARLAKACLAGEAHQLSTGLIDQGLRRFQARDFEVQALMECKT
jgi:hypothetical protein